MADAEQDAVQWQEQKAKVDRFVARFGNEAYRLLAYYAALPLVLTPELVNYLRNEFLRDKDVPWEAEVDLLLSDLCSQVSYELYAMDSKVRAYLLEEAQDRYPLWQQRMREVAQVLISYVNFLSRIHPEQRQQELEAQRLAAMVYLGDEACQRAVQEIAERLKQVSDSAEAGASERGVRAELARLTRITQELAPQLQQAPNLVEFAKLVQRMLRNPESVGPAELQQVHQVGDVALTVSPRFFPTRRQPVEQVEIPGFPPIELLEFETAQLVVQEPVFPPLQTQTVEVATLSFFDAEDESDAQSNVGLPNVELQPFEFEVVTIQQLIFETEDLERFVREEIEASSSQKLSDLKRRILKGVLQGWSYNQIAESNSFAVDYVKQTGAILWKQLSEIFGLNLTKSNLKQMLTRLAIDKRGIQRVARTGQQFIEPLNDQISLEMVLIPGGSFLMGSSADELERTDYESPQHLVTIQPFLIAKYPITQAQWRIVTNFPQINQPLNPDPSYFKGEPLPVEQVSWDDAVEFCERLSAYTRREYHLPSEAEWEYACRAGTTTPFHFGETITTELANYDGNSVYGEGIKGQYRASTTPVGSFEVANRFGLYDMHGNVWEWCEDYWHDNYEYAPTDGSAWITETEDANRILRGGSWGLNPRHCRSAYRLFNPPDGRLNNIGFRVVCVAPRTL